MKEQNMNNSSINIGPVVVGDIFVHSWGYDQTNVDFYQVIRVSPHYAWLQPIHSRVVPRSEGHMCADVVPAAGDFDPTGKVLRVRLPVADDRPVVKMRHGQARRHVEGRSYYCSWYA